MRVYLSIGSNEDAARNLRKGVQWLRQALTVVAISPVYASPAVDGVEAAPYLNAVVIIETDEAPAVLKARLVRLEDRSGRVHRDEQGNKSKQVTLDFDILLYENGTTDYEFAGKPYMLPHPDLTERAYVVVPLAALEPDFVHPATGQTIQALLNIVDAAAMQLLPDLDLNE